MALMPWVNLILQILWNQVMPFVGVLALVVLGLVKMGHKIPMRRARESLGFRLLGRGSRILGRTLVAIKDADGLWTLKPGTYDSENEGYWVPTENGREFFDAKGVGGDPGGWYGGTSLAVAYDGLGAFAEVAAGEVGRQARVKKQTFEEDLKTIDYAKYKAGKAGKRLLADASEKLLDRQFPGLEDAGDEAVAADGGTIVGEWEVALPKRKIVDLRDTIYAAPFAVRPQSFHNVAESAKKGQRGFAKLGPLGQAGLLMGAFMLGAIVTYLGFTAGGGGGGGGGGLSIPMGYIAVTALTGV